MNTEREERGGGFSFIINEGCWDCFEDDFMQANGCCVFDLT